MQATRDQTATDCDTLSYGCVFTILILNRSVEYNGMYFSARPIVIGLVLFYTKNSHNPGEAVAPLLHHPCLPDDCKTWYNTRWATHNSSWQTSSLLLRKMYAKSVCEYSIPRDISGAVLWSVMHTWVRQGACRFAYEVHYWGTAVHNNRHSHQRIMYSGGNFVYIGSLSSCTQIQSWC